MMMKKLLILLFVIGSSNAFAQHNVPGGGPVGSPGNPGTGHPGGYNPGNGGYGGGHGDDHNGGWGHGDDHNGGYGHGGYPGHDGDDHNGGYGHGGYPGNYPGGNPYPTPYPNPYPYPVPAPSYPVGPCVINSQYSGNSISFIVYDGRGNYISSYYDYTSALRTAESYDQMGYCHGVKDNTNQNPNPYPIPHPQTYCTVMPGQDAYGRQFFR
ncbi:MAG: hypothetical protein WCF65_09675, partial [Parachlamydiaceae bacterium]